MQATAALDIQGRRRYQALAGARPPAAAAAALFAAQNGAADASHTDIMPVYDLTAMLQPA